MTEKSNNRKIRSWSDDVRASAWLLGESEEDEAPSYQDGMDGEQDIEAFRDLVLKVESALRSEPFPDQSDTAGDLVPLAMSADRTGLPGRTTGSRVLLFLLTPLLLLVAVGGVLWLMWPATSSTTVRAVGRVAAEKSVMSSADAAGDAVGDMAGESRLATSRSGSVEVTSAEVTGTIGQQRDDGWQKRKNRLREENVDLKMDGFAGNSVESARSEVLGPLARDSEQGDAGQGVPEQDALGQDALGQDAAERNELGAAAMPSDAGESGAFYSLSQQPLSLLSAKNGERIMAESRDLDHGSVSARPVLAGAVPDADSETDMATAGPAEAGEDEKKELGPDIVSPTLPDAPVFHSPAFFNSFPPVTEKRLEPRAFTLVCHTGLGEGGTVELELNLEVREPLSDLALSVVPNAARFEVRENPADEESDPNGVEFGPRKLNLLQEKSLRSGEKRTACVSLHPLPNESGGEDPRAAIPWAAVVEITGYRPDQNRMFHYQFRAMLPVQE